MHSWLQSSRDYLYKTRTSLTGPITTLSRWVGGAMGLTVLEDVYTVNGWEEGRAYGTPLLPGDL